MRLSTPAFGLALRLLGSPWQEAAPRAAPRTTTSPADSGLQHSEGELCEPITLGALLNMVSWQEGQAKSKRRSLEVTFCVKKKRKKPRTYLQGVGGSEVGKGEPGLGAGKPTRREANRNRGA